MIEWESEFNPFNSWKVIAWQDHIRGILDGNFLPPVVVNWDLVLGCNYRCGHCIWAKRRVITPTKVPDEFINSVPKFLHDWGVKAVCLAGESGDPSLHPSLGIALRLLHHWNLEIGYVSNGFVMKDMEAIAHYCKFAGFSIDAGREDAYAKVHHVDVSSFFKVIDNINSLSNYACKKDLPVEIGYKVLILPDSYRTIAEGAKIARDIGVRDYQIRPAELPESEIAKIDLQKLEEQLNLAHELETDSFHVYSIRHKFDGLKKKKQKHCWATPLTSTWIATGEVVLCVDLRDEKYNTLCNYLRNGLPRVRELWGGMKHREIIDYLNNNLDKCKRCTNGGYNFLIQKAFKEDSLDIRLI